MHNHSVFPAPGRWFWMCFFQLSDNGSCHPRSGLRSRARSSLRCHPRYPPVNTGRRRARYLRYSYATVSIQSLQLHSPGVPRWSPSRFSSGNHWLHPSPVRACPRLLRMSRTAVSFLPSFPFHVPPCIYDLLSFLSLCRSSIVFFYFFYHFSL